MIDIIEADAPWRFAPLPTSACSGWAEPTLACRVSVVPEDLTPAIEEDGLRTAADDDLKRLLPSAQGWLGAVPELEQLVLHVVRDIHPLAAELGYDVSHSQPQWRERIFVSCPERANDVGALRLIEGIIHEAMHLHLTNEEKRGPLVAVSSGVVHSPWREIDRPVQGVMHGMFVFACIHRFLRALTTTSLLADDAHCYVEGRLATIEDEIGQIDLNKLSLRLTARGRASVASWLRSIERPQQKTESINGDVFAICGTGGSSGADRKGGKRQGVR